MGEYAFCYENYKKLCELILSTGRLLDYKQVQKLRPKAFIILRHDVEFSPARAYALGCLEHALGVCSTYFFQVSNHAYNAFSARNLAQIRELAAMGHHIGLHFHLNGMHDLTAIQTRIRYEIDALSYYTGIPVDRFSYHRPTPLVLQTPVVLPNVINAYAPEFFTYYESGSTPPANAVKYIADSKNHWQYTAPFDAPAPALFDAFPQMQILCHPYSWTERGFDTLHNLQSLVSEHRQEFIETLNSETKYVKEYIDAL